MPFPKSIAIMATPSVQLHAWHKSHQQYNKSTISICEYIHKHLQQYTGSSTDLPHPSSIPLTIICSATKGPSDMI